MKSFIRNTGLFFLLLSANSLHAQWDDGLWVGKQAYNWIFSKDIGLNFDTSPPTMFPVITKVSPWYSTTATISSPIGDLQFYIARDTSSIGGTIWNRNHQVMNNGTGIAFDINFQNGLVVPVPGPSNEYYVFYTNLTSGNTYHIPFPNVPDMSVLFYSIVDMDLDNGLGKVTAKNVLLDVPMASNKITAAYHANGEDIWLITHAGGAELTVGSYISNDFYAYLITENGIEPPVISSVGLELEYSDGQLKASPDGSKIASVSGLMIGLINSPIYCEVFDFNKETGEVTNPINLSGALGPIGLNGVEFSPNSRYIYVSETGYLMDLSRINQFDLHAGNQSDIIASKVKLMEEFGSPYVIQTMQLTPNGKIMMPGGDSLKVIHYPNNKGIAAGFELDGFYLQGRMSSSSLPIFIQSYFESGILHVGNCIGQEVAFSTLRIPGVESATWDFGDPNSGADNTATTPDGTSSHVFSGPGTYTVTATITSNGAQQTATTEITIMDVEASQPDNMVACDDGSGNIIFDLSQQDSAILNGQDPNTHTVSYHTTQNDVENNTNPITNPTAYVSSGQTIYARVTTNGSCYAVTQFDLEVSPTPQLPDNMELVACLPMDLTKIASEVGTGLNLGFYPTENDAENSVNAIADSTAYYPINGDEVYLRVENATGCADIATLTLIGEECAIPQGISPNGDQWNQSFDLSYMNIQNLEIFNRYGRSVFNKPGYTNEWFGQTDGGDELPTGTYFYVIKLEEGYTFQGKSVLTGWVYVQREVN